MTIYTGEKLTLTQLNAELDGNMGNYDIIRDLLDTESKTGAFDVRGINYEFSYTQLNTESPTDTVVTITDIEEL